MKKHALLLPLFLFLLSYCFADGGLMPMPDYRDSVFMPEQKAVILWDGSTEQLVLESKITAEDIANLAWLIPVESSTKPIVEAADEEIFFRLADLFRPKPKSTGVDFLGVAREGGVQGVEVIEQLKVDIYDITILRATDETALINWLNQNGYSFPEAFPNLLSDYVKSGNFYFIANKINLQNKYPGLQPTSQDFECAQVIVSDPWLGQSFYGGVDEIAGRIKYMLDDPRCTGASVEPTAVIVSLRLGIATPLKITFTPSKPFYPMLLSSVNLGKGKALVYFVSGKPYKDSSGLFSTEHMLQMKHSGLSEYGVNAGDFVTLLSWEGNYSALGRDSFFAETAFDPTLDPDYVPPVPIWLTIAQTLALFLFILLFFLLPISFFWLALPFVIGFLIGLALEEKDKKKGILAGSRGWAAIAVLALLFILGPVVLTPLLLLPPILVGGLGLELIPGFLLYITLIFAPYFVSMASGLMFKKSGYKKKWLLVPIAIFVLLGLAILISMALYMPY